MIYDRIISFRNDKTIFQHENMSIKVFGKSYSQSDVYEEALNQIRARETGKFNVPEVLSVVCNEGKWSIVSEYIEGSTLKEIILKDDSKFDELLEQFVALQALLHKQKSSSLLPMYFTMAKYRSDKNLKYVDFSKKSMCHLDFNTDNIVLSKDGKMYIIDWANLASGDELYDSASTYLNMLYMYGEKRAEQYLNCYCNLTGAKKEDILRLKKAVATVRISKAIGHRIEFLSKILYS